MNILQDFIENVKQNFESEIKKYKLTELIPNKIINSFDNYISFIKCIDNLSVNYSKDLYIKLLNYLDDAFFNSEYRKKHCSIMGFSKRTLITFWGEITFYRRRYYDSFKNKQYYFIDNLFFFDKYKCFDPFVCAKICEESSHNSYAKAARNVSFLIGNRLKLDNDANKYFISRATARNIVMSFDIPSIPYKYNGDIDTLYVMLDEKWIHSQFNNNLDFMVKAAVVFEDVYSEYKYKKKKDSMNRYRLSGKYVLASIDNDLDKQLMDYIYYSYNTDNLKEIVFMGDCANWITSFPKSFKFHKDLKITFAIDGYHYVQALQHITTNKYSHLYIDSLKQVIKDNDKLRFINLCESLILLEPNRKDTIIDKQNYILNNWSYIQNYYYNVSMKCSMESNISHCFADIFTSRPRAYSKKGLKQLLKLRLLKVNNIDIQQLYFDIKNNLYKDIAINYNLFTNEIKSCYLYQQWLTIYSNQFNISPLF